MVFSRILSQLRSAAGNQTKLVIGDMLLPYACAEDPHLANDSVSNEWTNSVFPFVPSDSPLLPNLGKANMYGYLTDIVVSLHRTRVNANDTYMTWLFFR